MTGTKRRRKTGSGDSCPNSAKKKKKKQSGRKLTLELIQSLFEIQSDTQVLERLRETDARILQLPDDMPCDGEATAEEIMGYHILLGCHMLERLASFKESVEQVTSSVWLALALAPFAGTLLVHSNDRVTLRANAERVAVASAMAALRSMTHMMTSTAVDPVTRLAAALALECAVSVPTTTVGESDKPNHWGDAVWHKVADILRNHAMIAIPNFNDLEHLWDESSEKCWIAIQNGKSQTVGVAGNSQSTLSRVFSNTITTYCLSYYSLEQRWTSLAVADHGMLHAVLPGFCLELLEETSFTWDNALPAKVAVLALISRLIHLLKEVRRNSIDRDSNLLNYMECCWKRVKIGPSHDERDVGTYLAYKLIQLHHETLANVDTKSSVVNESDDPVQSLSSYYPALHATLQNLVEFVADSLAQLTLDSQMNARHIFERLLCSFIIGNKKGPLDARLMLFAMKHVNAAVQSSSDHMSLRGQLPLPSLKEVSRRKRKVSKQSSYAGMIHDDKNAPDLPYLMRTMGKHESWEEYCSAFLDWVIGILEACYHTRGMEKGSAGVKAGRKRRKPDPMNRITETRAGLASATLDTLTLCLRHHYSDQSTGNLQKIMRASLNLNQINRLVHLEYNLASLIKRTGRVAHQNTPVNLLELDNTFQPWEKNLWTSHMNMCICLGSGRTSYRRGIKHNLFGDKQIEVFKQISSFSCSEDWPLWLPPSHRLIVASNLASEERRTESPSTDQFIVDGALNAIMKRLNDLSSLSSQQQVQCEVVNAYDVVYLSYEDIRLILAAFTNLPAQRQALYFSRLVDMVENWLNNVDGRAQDYHLLKIDNEVASFLARVIVLCSNSYSLLRFGPTIRRELRELLGSSQLPMELMLRARPVHGSEKCASNVPGLGNWDFTDDSTTRFTLEQVDTESEAKLRSLLEKSFQLGFVTSSADHGLLLSSAWNGLGKADLWDLTKRITPAPSGTTAHPSKTILELRNELCFAHRLLGRALCRSAKKSSLVMTIEEIEEGDESLSSRECAIEASSCLILMVKKATAMLNQFVADAFPEKAENSYGDTQIPAEQISLVQVLTTYLCFAISSLTTTQNDIFSSTYADIFEDANKRGRAYSTESDNSYSEAYSSVSQDFAFSTFERLQSVCKKIGSVPAHPDWLDRNCRLLDGTSYDTCLQHSLESLSCLTGLLACSLRRSKDNQRSAFRTTDNRQESDLAALAVELCWLRILCGSQSIDEDSVTCFVEHVSNICTVDFTVLHSIYEKMRSRDEQLSCWCKKSAQRVQGRLHDMLRSGMIETDAFGAPILRASDEWEILLSKGLNPITSGVGSNQDKNSMNGWLIQADLWLSVLRNTLECLKPVSALLRFSLTRKGREPHPLGKFSTVVDDINVVTHAFMYEKYPSGIQLPSATKAAIVDTLSVMMTVPCDNSMLSAISCQLADLSTFVALKGVATCRWTLEIIEKLHGICLSSREKRLSIHFVTDMLGDIIDAMENPLGDKFALTCAAVGVIDMKKIQSIAWLDVDENQFFTMRQKCTDARSLQILSRKEVNERLVVGISKFLWPDCPIATHRSRVCFLHALSNLAKNENNSRSDSGSNLIHTISKQIGQATDEQFLSMIENHLLRDCQVHICDEEKDSARRTQVLTCYILTIIMIDGACCNKLPLLVKKLMKKDASWWELPRSQRLPLLNVLLLYSTVIEKLDVVGSHLASRIQPGKESGLESSAPFDDFACLCTFANSIQSRLQQLDNDDNESHEMLPASCSYARFSDFCEQHWYHCYTCGLTGDKGCCTVCAIACHAVAGHDVSYARYSSFFCDCGAELGSEAACDTLLRAKCQCLRPVRRSDIDRIVRAICSAQRTDARSRQPFESMWIVSHEDCAFFALTLFEDHARVSLQKVKTIVLNSDLSNILLKHVKTEFSAWKSSPMALASRLLPNSDLYSCRVASLNERECFGETHKVDRFTTSLCHFRKLTLTVDKSLLKRSDLADHVISRRALEADSRGRLIIGEGSTIIFCNALAIVNSTDATYPLTRSSLRILGQVEVGFEVIGLHLARIDERLLVVWGCDEVTVLRMDGVCNISEQRIDLRLEVDTPYAHGGVQHCAWCQGSSEILVVCCRRLFLLYNVRSGEGKPMAHLRLTADVESSHELELVTFALAPARDQTNNNQAWNAFLLLTDGSIHRVMISRRADEGVSLSKAHLLPGKGLRLDLIPGNSLSSKDLFEFGTKLSYLEQSNILVYEVGKKFVYGIIPDSDGEIEGSFTLISHRLSGIETDRVSPEYDIEGFYSHWVEHGLVKVEQCSAPCFRVSCIGRAVSSGAPVLVKIDFNKTATNVYTTPIGCNSKEILSPAIVIDGCCAFSGPQVSEKRNDYLQSSFSEQTYIALVTSEGSLYIYKESTTTPCSRLLEPYITRTGEFEEIVPIVNTKFQLPLLAFENLTNITETIDIFFPGSNRESSNKVKSRLLKDNDEFLRSPELEGFSVHLTPKQYGTDERGDVVITALRLLFGSSSLDCIPKFISVQGRQIELDLSTKRFYSVQLSAQEILLAIRSCVVTICIGEAADGTSRPVLDAIEVYGSKRSLVLPWEPKAVKSFVSIPTPYVDNSTECESTARFSLALKALTSFHRIFNTNRSIELPPALLKEILHETTLLHNPFFARAARELISSFSTASSDHDFYIDSATISSCAQFLAGCSQILGTIDDEQYFQFWFCIRPVFHACLRAATGVARLRPRNYLKAVCDCFESIAVRASTVMDHRFTSSNFNGDIVAEFVELCLLERATARAFGADYGSHGRLVGFEVLHRFLISPNSSIVSRTTLAIEHFCSRYRSAEHLIEGEFDLFEARKMVVAYGCDGCGLFPLRDIRYALHDDDHPIDLCTGCYRAAKEFATAKKRDGNADVLISGKTVGAGSKLRCSEVLEMKNLPIDPPSDGCIESMQQPASKEAGAQVFQRQQLFQEYVDGLWTTIVNLITNELEKQDIWLSSLVTLIYELNRLSGHKVDKRLRLARKIVESLSRITQKYLSVSEKDETSYIGFKSSVSRFVVALSTLIVPDDIAREYLVNPANAVDHQPLSVDQSITRGKCSHDVLFARRTFVQGKNKGRVFGTCAARSKAHHCNFFVWLDESTESRPLFNESIRSFIWTLISSEKEMPSLSEMLGRIAGKEMQYVKLSLISVAGQGSRVSNGRDDQWDSMDYSDGAYCSLATLHSMTCRLQEHRYPRKTSNWKPCEFVHRILELMALVSGAENNSESCWFSLLSQILLSTEKGINFLRPPAKRALWQLCGQSTSRFLEIRDRILFEGQFEIVTTASQALRDYCCVVYKKVQSQIKHRHGAIDTPDDTGVRLRHVVGAVDLVSEDAILQVKREEAHKALECLLSTASRRASNWRKFCFSHLPSVNKPPLETLLELSSLLHGDLQMKAMKLASLAVSEHHAIEGAVVSDAGPERGSTKTSDWRSKSGSSTAVVYKTRQLLHSVDVDLDDLYMFVHRFVCNEECHEIRKMATSLALGLAVGKNLVESLFNRCRTLLMAEIGQKGRLCFEFLTLLKALVKFSSPGVIHARGVAHSLDEMFVKQIVASSSEKVNNDSFQIEVKSTSSIQNHRFELARCAHVISRPTHTVGRLASPNEPAYKKRPIPEQVSPAMRMRLDTTSETASSNEFNCFICLPHRCVLSEVIVKIADARGRFVKEIQIYYSPRPVANPAALKAREYNDTWLLCGTLKVPKGAEKVSCSLSPPLVAANLRIEYSDFYDRPGSLKSDAFVVHCPRCTRVVTNAHGVCGSCGEVAFQCRKCRHINYDRLDAYLCVECGFCASASISYEVSAGVASNAMAITCDRDYKQAVQMFAVSSKILEDLRLVLRHKLRLICAPTNIPADAKLPATMQRALDGYLPLPHGQSEDGHELAQSLLKRHNKRGSVVKTVAQKYKARLTAARPTRAETLIIRHGRRNLDEEDEDASTTDFFGSLLESSGIAQGLDPSDPVSRLIATVQRQRERARETQQLGHHDRSRGAATTATGKDKSVEECEKLHRSMHEAQRECFALNRRIDAWKRAESGNLCFPTDHCPFIPSPCSICCHVIAQQLLTLWHSVFMLDPSSVHTSKKLLAILLQDDSALSGSLQETKRKVVKDIALNSPESIPSILEGLRLRLTTLQDTHGFKILGMILKEGRDSTVVEPFLGLASEVMESNPIP